jgi:hypothetical protein
LAEFVTDRNEFCALVFQSSQKSGLDGQAGTEGEGHAWSWGLGFTQPVEDEQNRRRGHVAVVGQNVM